MERIDNDLLRPSLRGAAVLSAPYSTRVGMLTAFFGGPFAAVALQGINAHRLGRLGREAVLLAGLLLSILALDLWVRRTGALSEGLAGMLGTDERDARRILSRAIALGIFALGLFVHRQPQRTADLMGLPRPNGIGVGIGLIIGGTLASVVWHAASAGLVSP
jgi:hypothetical protein